MNYIKEINDFRKLGLREKAKVIEEHGFPQLANSMLENIGKKPLKSNK